MHGAELLEGRDAPLDSIPRYLGIKHFVAMNQVAANLEGKL